MPGFCMPLALALLALVYNLMPACLGFACQVRLVSLALACLDFGPPGLCLPHACSLASMPTLLLLARALPHACMHARMPRFCLLSWLWLSGLWLSGLCFVPTAGLHASAPHLHFLRGLVLRWLCMPACLALVLALWLCLAMAVCMLVYLALVLHASVVLPWFCPHASVWFLSARGLPHACLQAWVLHAMVCQMPLVCECPTRRLHHAPGFANPCKVLVLVTDPLVCQATAIGLLVPCQAVIGPLICVMPRKVILTRPLVCNAPQGSRNKPPSLENAP